ncbi:MAG: LemA family protein [Limisphaerales bacterium]
MRYLALAVFWLFILGGWFLQKSGYNTLQEMRQLERIPRSQINSIIGGEVNLAGSIFAYEGNLLKAPYSNTECVAFHYLLEEERTDSDGDRYWVTIDEYADRAPYILLRDATGQIIMRTHNADIISSSSVYRSGKLRYTEWRLHEGEKAFIFGYSRGLDSNIDIPNYSVRPGKIGRYLVEFQTDGLYTPIISVRGEKNERRRMATKSLWKSWGAMSLGSLGALLLCLGSRIHRLLVFLSISSMLQGVFLVYIGLNMLEADMQNSRNRAQFQQESAKKAVAEIFRSISISWDGDWDDDEVFNDRTLDRLQLNERLRAQGIYGDTSAGITRFNSVRDRFPERFLCPLWGISKLDEMSLANSFAPDYKIQQTIEEVPISKFSMWIMLILGLLVALVGAWIGFRAIKIKRYIENIPTSLSSGLAYGPTELIGTLFPTQKGAVLKGPVSNLDVVYYHYVVKEERGSGKDTKWVTIVDEEKSVPFFCGDSGGKTLVHPYESEIHSQHKHSRSSGNRIYSETNLRPKDKMYILGPAIVDYDHSDRLMISRDDSNFPFLVCNLSEDEMMQKKGAKGLIWLNFSLNGFILAGLGCFGAAAAYAPTDYLYASMISPLFLTLSFIILMFNDLQFVRHRVRRAWANIDVSLKKRADLIPNLEKTVKTYLSHESEIQKDLAELRSQIESTSKWNPETASELINTEKKLTDALLVRCENYPDLKADKVVQKLFDKLVSLENEIALMRKGYNDSVERHNTRIQSVPELFIAKALRLKEHHPISAEIEVRSAPNITGLN